MLFGLHHWLLILLLVKMNKNYLLLGLSLLFLFQSPVVFSIDCTGISSANYDLCKEILNSDISEEEKELIIPNLDYDNQFFPDHEFIFDRNLDLDISEVPDNVEIQEKEFIKSTWAKIFAIMPSVFYNGTLYAPKETSVFTGFNHEIEIPDNYYSSGYPRTSQGDCKRKYYLVEDESENKVYVNNQYVGEGDLVDLSIYRDSQIKIIYSIYVKVKIKHYEWERYCKRWRLDGTCRRYDEDCEYDYTEYDTEQITITDTININSYKNNLFAEVTPINIYNGVTNLKTNFSDSVEINFKNAEYSFNKYIYSIKHSIPPYYVSTLLAEDYNQEKIYNLFTGENTIAVRNADNCEIEAFDFFNILEKECNDEYQNINFFIKTDKLKYDNDEDIKVEIFPTDISAKINYGDISKIAKGKVTLNAKEGENRIIAEYNGLISEKIIYITNRSRIILLWNLFVFAMLNFLLYILLKKYYNKTK